MSIMVEGLLYNHCESCWEECAGLSAVCMEDY